MKFSIVIPTSDKEQNLKYLLINLTKLDYERKDFEVIIANNSRTKKVAKVVQVFKKMFGDFSVQVVSVPAMGVSFARNVGSRLAKYDHLIYVDDDCRLPVNFLQRYKKAWQVYPEVAVIGGKVKVLYDRLVGDVRKKEKIIAAHPWCFAHLDYGNEAKILDKEPVYTANLSLHKKEFDVDGGIFNEDLGINLGCQILLGGEDTEFCQRSHLAGKKIVYFPAAVVGNQVGEIRFKREYLQKRYFIMGLELFRTEAIIKKTYGESRDNYLNFFFWSIMEDLKKGKITFLADFFIHSEKMYLLWAYFFCGRFFI